MYSRARLIFAGSLSLALGFGLGFLLWHRSDAQQVTARSASSTHKRRHVVPSTPAISTTEPEIVQTQGHPSRAAAIIDLCAKGKENLKIACDLGDTRACERFFYTENNNPLYKKKVVELCKKDHVVPCMASINYFVPAKQNKEPYEKLLSLCKKENRQACKALANSDGESYTAQAIEKIVEFCKNGEIESCNFLFLKENSKYHQFASTQLALLCKPLPSMAKTFRICASFMRAIEAESISVQKKKESCLAGNVEDCQTVMKFAREEELIDREDAKRSIAFCEANEFEECLFILRSKITTESEKFVAEAKVESLCQLKNVFACEWVVNYSTSRKEQRQTGLTMISHLCETRDVKACAIIGKYYTEYCTSRFGGRAYDE